MWQISPWPNLPLFIKKRFVHVCNSCGGHLFVSWCESPTLLWEEEIWEKELLIPQLCHFSQVCLLHSPQTTRGLLPLPIIDWGEWGYASSTVPDISSLTCSKVNTYRNPWRLEQFLMEGNTYRIGVYWEGAFHSRSIGFLLEYLKRNDSHHPRESISSWTALPIKNSLFSMIILTLFRINEYPDFIMHREHSQLNCSYFNSERKRKLGRWYGKKNLSAQIFQKTHQRTKQNYYTRLYSRFFQYVNHRTSSFFTSFPI